MNRRLSCVLGVAVVSSLTAVAAQTGGASRLLGFSAAASEAELAREATFKLLPSPAIAEQAFDVMTAEPHHTGSPAEIALADYVASRFEAAGLEIARHEYDVIIPWPGERTVEVLEPGPMRLQVEEELIKEDPASGKSGMLPSYNAYSAAGDVTGELVYVNYGVPADYETLATLGVDVKGRIVLARYGGSWRGIKPRVAAEHGALACLIYSDPREDGYYQGDVYPEGAWRGWGMTQRGSVLDMPRFPGDPTTPGRPSKPGVERVPLDKAETVMRIPVQPLSYRDGLELLKRLRGPVVPDAWRGALPVTYHIGPGPARVRVRLQMDYRPRRVINVVGTLTGATYPDQAVIVGAHRDAWVLGASDPVSGQVTILEVARAFGELARQGWRPKRSIVFISFDGEEQGLLGSTEYVEEFGETLAARAVVYVNRDSGAGRGWFGASAVHSLGPFVRELARGVTDPEEPAKSLYDRWLERARSQARPTTDQPPLAEPPIGALGSGSDYTGFLDHVGVPAIDMGISGDAGGTYHSIYDSPAWFRRFVDPGFHYTVASAQVTGLALMRLADAELLPFDYEAYGRQIAEYVGEIERDAKRLPGSGAAMIDFAGMRAACGDLTKAGGEAKALGESLLASTRDPGALAKLNDRLRYAERDLLDVAGLPERPWFRHTIYAPGYYTGYGVKTIPGVREAVEGKNASLAAEQARAVIAALGRAAARLRRR